MSIRSFTSPTAWRVEESGGGVALVGRPPAWACAVAGLVMVAVVGVIWWLLSGVLLAVVLVCVGLPILIAGGKLAAEWRAGPVLVWERESGVVTLPRMKQSFAKAEVRRLEIVEDRLKGSGAEVSVLEVIVQGPAEAAERHVAVCGAMGSGSLMQVASELAERMGVEVRQRGAGRE